MFTWLFGKFTFSAAIIGLTQYQETITNVWHWIYSRNQRAKIWQLTVNGKSWEFLSISIASKNTIYCSKIIIRRIKWITEQATFDKSGIFMKSLDDSLYLEVPLFFIYCISFPTLFFDWIFVFFSNCCTGLV